MRAPTSISLTSASPSVAFARAGRAACAEQEYVCMMVRDGVEGGGRGRVMTRRRRTTALLFLTCASTRTNRYKKKTEKQSGGEMERV